MNIQQLDFILSDYRLGQKSGIDYIQRIREEFNHEIPATIMTADTSPENIIVFSKLGINVLYKPIAPEELLTHVVHHFFDEQPIQH
jgi:DNA-binding response OmpR family regulator